MDYEAHGTGTVLGDPIEADALGRVVGRGRLPSKPLLMGSVKTSYGHMGPRPASGALAKVVLSMQRGEIPASSLHQTEPVHQFAANSLRVTTEATRMAALQQSRHHRHLRFRFRRHQRPHRRPRTPPPDLLCGSHKAVARQKEPPGPAF